MFKRFLFTAALGVALIGGGCAKTPSAPSPAVEEKPVVSSGVTPTAQAPELPVSSGVGASPSPQMHTVRIKNFAFSPPTLTVKVGDVVFWAQEDSVPHSVRSDEGTELASALLVKGQMYSHTFTTGGSFSYYCGPHPWMKGKVIVE